MKHCVQCTKNYEENINFCEHCGIELENNTKKKSAILLFLLVTVISSILATNIEVFIMPSGEPLVKTPGWTFRLCFGVAIGSISLLVYYFYRGLKKKN